MELVKPHFIVGDEKRFFDFIKGLNDKDKVAVLSHTDLDGITAAKVVNEVVKADIVKLTGYDELNEKLVEDLKKMKITKVIMTDLGLDKPDFVKSLEKFAKILYIDHHKFPMDINSDRIVFMNAHGFSAGYLSYYLFSKLQNLEKLDWLVACCSISDYLLVENSKWMDEVFKKYGEEFVPDMQKMRLRKKFWSSYWTLSLALIYYREDLPKFFSLVDNCSLDNLNDFKEIANEVQVDFNEQEKKFQKEKNEFSQGYYWESKDYKFPLSSFLINDMSERMVDKTLIFFRKKDNIYAISARRQDGKIDMNLFMKKLVSGLKNGTAGGHSKASGGSFDCEVKEEFIKRLKNI